MGFFTKILDKTKNLLGFQGSEKDKTKTEKQNNDAKEPLLGTELPHSVDIPIYAVPEETNAKKIIDDFVLMHPGACELFKNDLEKIRNSVDDTSFLMEYWEHCNFKIELYNDCIRDINTITHFRSRISVKLKPEVSFEVQGAVRENIELFKDLIPYVIKLFIYDCKKLVFNVLEFLHISKKEIGISLKSIADDFVRKIAMGITWHLREIIANNFSESDMSVDDSEELHCKEIEDIAILARKYNEIFQGTPDVKFLLDDIIGERYQEDLYKYINKVIARYENRHLVDKIKDYALILWYVLRFFYSIFFGAGFLYLILLGKNLHNWSEHIDSFFLKAGELFTPKGAEYASQFIAPMVAAALSKVTLILACLSAVAVLVYFAYRVNSVRTKISDIVNLNISMYSASLLDISIYQTTDKLIQDISFGVQEILNIPRPLLLNNNLPNNSAHREGRIDDRIVGMYIERVMEMRTLCERLIACVKNK